MDGSTVEISRHHSLFVWGATRREWLDFGLAATRCRVRSPPTPVWPTGARCHTAVALMYPYYTFFLFLSYVCIIFVLSFSPRFSLNRRPFPEGDEAACGGGGLAGRGRHGRHHAAPRRMAVTPVSYKRHGLNITFIDVLITLTPLVSFCSIGHR